MASLKGFRVTPSFTTAPAYVLGTNFLASSKRPLIVGGVRDSCVTVFGAYVETTGMFRREDLSFGPRITH